MTDSADFIIVPETDKPEDVTKKSTWLTVGRDGVIIILLTFIGGFVIGLVGLYDQPLHILAIAVSNLVFSIIGFTISGCLAKVERFKHLFKVTVLVWLFSLINVVLGFASITQWIFSILFILVAMGIGGGISFLIVKSDQKTPA